MNKQERTEALDFLSEAFDGCRAVLWDGDVWLLNDDKTYMFAIGSGRIGRQIDDGSHGGDITLEDLEDVIDVCRNNWKAEKAEKKKKKKKKKKKAKRKKKC